MTSPGHIGSGCTPLSTLMPGSEPAFSITLTSDVPSLAFWRMVSSYRMTPEIYFVIASLARNINSR